MPDPATIGIVISLATFGYAVIKDIAKNNQATAEQRREAKDALAVASRETRAYLEHLQAKLPPIRPKELELSQLWQTAASKLYPFNSRIANLLYLKAESWLNPESWPEEEIERAKIGFENIQNELRDMDSDDTDSDD